MEKFGQGRTFNQNMATRPGPILLRDAFVHSLLFQGGKKMTAIPGACVTEYLRPWKLVTLFIGTALLIAGSYYTPAPDWDIPISLIMALVTYLAAPWSVRVIYELKWRLWPAMMLATWFAVDGSYALYWHFKDPVALELMRAANFPPSLSLYALCGMIWFYRGGMRQMLGEIQRQIKLMRKGK
jgi:hypothetical protein